MNKWHYMARELPPIGKSILLFQVQKGALPKYTTVESWSENDNQIRLRYPTNNQFCYWMVIPKLKLSDRDDPTAEKIREQKEREKWWRDNDLPLDNDPFFYKY